MKKIAHITFKFFLYGFAVIGFALVSVYLAVTFGWTKTKGIVDTQHDYFQNYASQGDLGWSKDAEWQTFKDAIAKDAPTIQKAAAASGADPRMIVAVVATEQLRFFHTDRESYKKYFAPLSMLGSMSQYSWGIAGIKPDTAKQVESNLKNTTSPFYLGAKYENLLDFSEATTNDTSNSTSTNMTSSGTTSTSTIIKAGSSTSIIYTGIDQERFIRLTDQHNHYYSYLYAGLLLQEMIHQWKVSGYDISNQPGVIATLFNLGFEHSEPKANPQIGGAAIDINGTTYSFGGLAESFYNSSELTDLFPRK